ncbi:MAG: hypothetical protein ACXWG7_02555 [Chthoniobacterales bacterium]
MKIFLELAGSNRDIDRIDRGRDNANENFIIGPAAKIGTVVRPNSVRRRKARRFMPLT